MHTQSFKQIKYKVTLLAGDSFLERLDPARLGKNKKRVISIAKGGSKISQVQNSIENFALENEDLVVEKLFLNNGMDVLAKHYIFLIHSRRFNPLGY